MASNDRTPRYIIDITVDGNARYSSMEWISRKTKFCPSYGKPTTKNIEKFVHGLEDSQKAGGVNEHLGEVKVLAAKIRDQFNGQSVVAEWTRN